MLNPLHTFESIESLTQKQVKELVHQWLIENNMYVGRHYQIHHGYDYSDSPAVKRLYHLYDYQMPDQIIEFDDNEPVEGDYAKDENGI